MNRNFQPRLEGWINRHRISSLAKQVKSHEHPNQDLNPVIFFNVSSRIHNLSQNSAFSLLTGWGLRLAGIPVVNIVCSSGMSHCVLGVNRDDYSSPPPCESCISQSKRLFAESQVEWFEYQENEGLSFILSKLSLEELFDFHTIFNIARSESAQETKIPLGSMVVPSARWALRQHNLPDVNDTRYLVRSFMLSAYSLANSFAELIEKYQPGAVIVFNGIMYPEATVRWVAQRYGIPTITHEVGFRSLSAFFTTGEATAYPIHIPHDFELTPAQNRKLDSYIQDRIKGEFTMAGIRFWPEMQSLSRDTREKIQQFKQIVPIFTNVVYDTSQVHANWLFPHMFAWLDTLIKKVKAHPETLFFIRAHPDEMRPGTAKQSRESVRDWVFRNGVDRLSNVIFIDSIEYVSSYELIQLAKFVLVYNSSIGLEATLMGKPVLCGGKARYTQYPTVFLPNSREEFQSIVEKFLLENEIHVPPEFQENARRFLYYQLYRTSLPFNEYLQPGKRLGFVHLKPFNWNELSPENSETIKIIVDEVTSQLNNRNKADRAHTFTMNEHA
ncbi:MAG: hypothetical protein ACK2TW_08220 [Anaerolineales bacterium]|jgi:hypothetical protein